MRRLLNMAIPLNCPLDAAEMEAHPHGERTYHQCSDCSGIWVSRMFLQGLSLKRDEQLMGSLELLPPPTHRDHAIHCPKCNFLMLRREQQGVQIDLCPDCKAVWLDGGEIVHIGQASRRNLKKSQKARAEQGHSPAAMLSPGRELDFSGTSSEGILSEGILGTIFGFLLYFFD